MSGGPIDRRRVGPYTKALIQKEAVRLFNERGFRGTTMRDIAAACDLTPAAFYNHFDSKERLLAAIVTHTYDAMEAAVKDATASADPDPAAQLTASIRAMTRWIFQNPDYARLARRELRELEPLDRARTRKRSVLERAQVEAILEMGVKSGSFTLPPMNEQLDAIRMTSVVILTLVADVTHSFLQEGTTHSSRFEDLLVEVIGRVVGRPN